MMGSSTAAVISLRTGNRLLGNSFYGSEYDQFSSTHPKNYLIVVAQKSSYLNGNSPSNRPQFQAVKALKEHVNIHVSTASTSENKEDQEDENYDSTFEASLQSIVLLQKSVLEKQWKLPFDFDRLDSVRVNQTEEEEEPEKEEDRVIRSGTNPRERRSIARRKYFKTNKDYTRYSVNPELIHTGLKGGYLRKGILGKELLSHEKVVRLSKKIKDGLALNKHRSKLQEKLGVEPTDKQLARFLRISTKELRIRLLEASLAKEKLAMNNVRLVKSVAQKYDNMGVDMDDLIQGGLVGLLKGIDKYDPNKGFKVSTYVYYWIRQGVSKALVDNAGIMRIPRYLHERLGKIKNAKFNLELEGITPTIEKLAEVLKISEKKVTNATEAYHKVFSLDREIYTGLGSLPGSGDTFHSCLEDTNPDNDPWQSYQKWYIMDQLIKLLNSTLNEREREIVCLYHGLGGDPFTWDDIGKMYGLSRERVRQVGLVAMEKLKQEAKKKEMHTLLIKN